MPRQTGFFVLVPAVPIVWKNGSVRGLKARGDVTVDIDWANGKVTYFKLSANKGGKIKLINPENKKDITEFNGEAPYTVTGNSENGKLIINKI